MECYLTICFALKQQEVAQPRLLGEELEKSDAGCLIDKITVRAIEKLTHSTARGAKKNSLARLRGMMVLTLCYLLSYTEKFIADRKKASS